MHDSSKTVNEYQKFLPEIKYIRKKYGGKLLCKKIMQIYMVQFILALKRMIGN